MSDDGGDDSPPRPKRKIKKVMIVSSASESENDESVVVPGTRRKRLRVLSDEESSDSSGSSVIVAGVRRRRALPKLRDSDGDSDGSGGWVTDSDSGKPATAPPKPTSGFASDSSEGNSDKCSICLLRFTDQETGTPENCEHVFCFDCITEWSKNVNTCPVDRITFNSIIVRACMGGRVLRTEEVKVSERRSSVEMLVFEDLPTNCEICRRSDNEDTMLLCDSCDLGYHMHCLTPPLTEIPIDQWLCPNCDDLLEDAIHISEVDELFSDAVEIPEGPRPSALRLPRNVRRSARNQTNSDQPSTSSGGRRASTHEVPTTSRASRTSRPSTSSTTRRQTTTTKKRRKRRKTKTIIIEYEIEGNGKFPITRRVTRRVTRRLKKRKSKRQPRTVARRTHVRASVRAKLANLKTDQRLEITQSATAAVGVQNLAIQRHRAGIPSLSLMGDPNQLDYFSDEENHISESATTAVATRPTANILSAYRQARRKMITIPSPPHASAPPDVLSNILESQTLLHSKKSLVSISVDGSVNIKLQTNSNQDKSKVLKKEEKVDPTKAEASTKKAPTYPGQSRGGGGWGGGYRGSYPRDHPRDHQQNNANGNFGRGGNYDGNYGGNYQGRPGQNFNNFQGNMRREEPEYFDSFPRRPHQFPHNDEPSYSDRQRRAAPVENSRGPNFGPHLPNFQRNNDQALGRHSLNSSWPTYGGSGPRADTPPSQTAPQPRHSFGGFENPVDMRMSQVPPASTNTTADYSTAEAPRQEKRQPPVQSLPDSQAYRPLTQPPIFNFPKVAEVEKSEDEKSDSGLVIDTEKYDPTEPTNDDDSGDEKARRPPQPPVPPTAPPADPPPELPPPSALLPNRVQSILAGIDTSGMNVPPNVLDDAVRQVLQEHRDLMATPSGADTRRDGSDGDSDGDCPNFSIYSATSVHIASNTNLTDDITDKPNAEDNLEDLIQEDDEAAEAPPPVARDVPEKKHDAGKTKLSPVDTSMRKTEEEYKEKVSKRCPITTVTRNPIKIKLNTPSLIKRQVSLYDEEEASQEPEESENAVEEDKPEDSATTGGDDHAERSNEDEEDSSHKKINSSTNAQFRDTFTKESPKVTEPPQNKEAEINSETAENKVDSRVVDPEDKSNCPSDGSDGIKTPNSLDKSDARDDLEAHSDNESRSPSLSPRDEPDVDKEIDNVEKMTESISETEDERSYTPCLDENKSTKDASFDNDKDKGLDGLDTEMISEDEGNEMFSENDDAPSTASRHSPARPVAESEEGEIPDKKKERKRSASREETGKKKKKKESKKEGKEKSKSKKKGGDVSFKKLSKNGKERNYRDRDKDDKKERRGSDAEARHRKRREKRKDLERYDVRTVVTEKRRKLKDPFGRDVSPRGRSPTRSRSPASPARRRSPAPRSPPPSPRRSPAFSRGRRSPSPPLPRRSPARLRRSLSRTRRSLSRARKSLSRGRKSPSRPRRTTSPVRRTTSRGRRSPARRSVPRRVSPARARSASRPRRRRSASSPRVSPRRRSPAARRKRRRSAGASPARKASKKRKRPRSAARRASPAAPRRRSPSPPTARPPSPRTPPSPAEREPSPRPRADRLRRRPRDAPPPSKEVFTSGDNILVSVSFKEQERGEDGERRKRKEARRTRRKRRRAPAETEAAKPVAIIDLERSPFRELTPSPRNVIVLSDSDHGEKEPAAPAAPPPAPAEPAPEPPALGPQTPPEPAAPEPEPAPAPAPPDAEEGGSPDAYDPFEPTRSASASPAHAGSPGAASPPSLTLEAAQRSNLSADEVLARRPLSPAEKVLALLQSQRAAEPEPPPEPPRPEPPRPLPKLFPGKPSPIKSNPVKPMQAARLPWPPSDAGASPYSPGSSDFGELFEPPAPRRAPKSKPHKKKGKSAIGVAVDEENLKILDELPSSAVALQVKNKFLKKLNRQERVVEEVKLVLKPHYNRRRVSKDEYKEILRRCVPKICHNKTGEINPTKIQALVEAYVKKFRKKRKLGIA